MLFNKYRNHLINIEIMENCFVKMLRATVDNPNLPIFEIMQQVTLDAIAASGNNSMTNAQKWALNHFFYQIGAGSNTGIFAKTKALFLPLICNQNQNTALFDYKRNVNIAISNWSFFAFDGNGLKGDGGTKTISDVITELAQSINTASFATYFVSKDGDFSYNNGLIRFTDADSNNTDIEFNNNFGGNFCGVQDPRVRARINTSNVKGYVASITGYDLIRAKYILASGYVAPQDIVQVVSDSETMIDTINKVSLRFGTNISQGIIAFFDGLSELEETEFATAMHELAMAF